ncbi:MAG TPA: lysyl oxidase family protein [Thermomicrobiales bacterium]|nr:lysyl oxidase family protein [Thermomicrobiales bacterium]
MRRTLSRLAWLYPVRATRWLTFLVLIALEFGWVGLGAAAVGTPLYPDLITTAPSGLYIEKGPDGKYLLRFANTAVNLGGRLEIAVGSGTRDIYQNIYDQNVGGNRVIHQKVGADLIYHPQHNHFHFEDFAKYELLKKDSSGYYRATTRTGSKTTYCILDTLRVGTDGPTKRQYDGCGATVQGLSAGWGDTYIASLFGQWIDLGTKMLPDGKYAIRSTADPDDKLMELNDFNNVGIAYFTIQNGRLSSDALPPLCSLQTVNGGMTGQGNQVNATVGSPIMMNCLRFGSSEPVEIFWGSVNTTPKAMTTSSSGGAIAAQIVVPQSTLGVHYVIARGQTSGTQVAAVVNTMPSIFVTPKRGAVGTQLAVTLRGYSAAEQVDIRFYKSSSSSTSVGTVAVAGNGSGTATFAIPVTPFGPHAVEGVGLSSGARSRASVVVLPSIVEVPDAVEAGAPFGIALRGFGAGERVSFTLDEAGPTVGTVVTSHSGSTTTRTAILTFPAETAPGDYTLSAIGEISRAKVKVGITVSAPTASEEPVPTPPEETASPTVVPTSPPEASPTSEVASPVPETPTPESSPNASPVAVAPPDVEVTDMDGDGSEIVTLDGAGSSDADGDQLTFAWSITERSPTTGEPMVTVLSTDSVAKISLPVGEHTVTLTVTDSLGSWASDEVIVRILAPPAPEASP